MARRSMRSVAALTALALVFALAPATALASPRDRGAKARADRRAAVARRVQSVRPTALDGLVPYVTPDPRDGGDDTPAGASDLTKFVTGANPDNGFGKATYDIPAVFATATPESSPGKGDFRADVDWYRIDVGAFEVGAGIPLTIEAKTDDPYVDPVIEVYGPATAGTVDPTDPAELVDENGWGITDADTPGCVIASDNGPWWDFSGGYSAGVTFVPKQAGRYFVRVRPWFDGRGAQEDPATPVGYSTSENGAGPYSLRVKAGVITRLAGGGRVQTAIELSRERYADGELPLLGGAVVLTNGWNFPDALAGSTLAGAVWGPLLLTHQGYLDADVKHEIERLGADRVFILGSETAVSAAVESALVGVNGMTREQIVRVEGAGRVQTAIEIARTAEEESGIRSVAFVANGWSFPDALAASPMAAWNYAPILLTHKDDLDDDTLDAVGELGITDVIVLGSEMAVGPAVYSALERELGQGHVKRIGGGDRYDTARKIAQWATGDFGLKDYVGADATEEENKLDPLRWDMFGVAAGYNYPDALGGGAFTGNVGYPLLLNPQGAGVSPRILDIQETLPAGSSYLSFDAEAPNYVGNVRRSYVFGGPTVVDNSVWLTLDAFATMPPE